MTPLPFAALALGFLGSTHCLAMCGGFVGLAQAHGKNLPIADRSRTTASRTLAKHAGRLTSYALAGALAGGAGRVTVASWQGALEIGAGVLLVGLGFHLCGLLPGYARLETLGAPLWRALRPVAQRVLPARTAPQAFAMGALWGWLPCGLVYSALSLALLSGSACRGATIMAFFGAGTMPALLAAGALIGWLRRRVRGAALRIAAGALVTMLGGVHLTLAAQRAHTPSASCHGHG